jgi:hypothetical protein
VEKGARIRAEKEMERMRKTLAEVEIDLEDAIKERDRMRKEWDNERVSIKNSLADKEEVGFDFKC